ncbi:MAG: hypothetical protein VX294_04010 [Candidatus Latescibacterota bacterium]|nr:hypothetical protein [Candidatus Latescibacterota bacterium]
MPQKSKRPENYDEKLNLISHQVSGQTFHATIPSVQLASDLMSSNDELDISEAALIFRAVLACQEINQNDPHWGNFRWEKEDNTVEDLNAVQFVLFNFIPVLLKKSKMLPSKLVKDMRHSIALGLNEICKIDVALSYTNIVVKDIVNCCLGGQLLCNPEISFRGKNKLILWIEHVNTYGLPAEYNSPNYVSVVVRVLGSLVKLTDDKRIRICSETMLSRIGLSAALHVHPKTRNWGGPFSRAYSHAVFNPNAFNSNDIETWIEDGNMPRWVKSILQRPNKTEQIDETAHGLHPVAISTYHSPSFTLGVASSELKTQDIIFIALQSCVFHTQFLRPKIDCDGVVFSRYILDDKWLNFQTTPSRDPGQVIPEEGHFYGVHDKGRVIGLYAPRGLDAWTRRTSAKAIIVWTEIDKIDEIWVGNQKIDSLPFDVPKGKVIVIGSGNLWTAVLPLELTDLGGGSPIILTELDGHLCLEMYNYKGPAKTFWEMARPGSFYQGQPRCGFYAELSERSNYKTGADLSEMIQSGLLVDKAQAPSTYIEGVNRKHFVEYSRDDQVIGIEIDLFSWSIIKRWTQDGVLNLPMHKSPYAQQIKSGTLSQGGATIESEKGPIWLYACPTGNRYVAAYCGTQRTTFILSVYGKTFEMKNFGTGTIEWENGEIIVNAIID